MLERTVDLRRDLRLIRAQLVAVTAARDAAIAICDSVNADPTVGPYTGAEHCVTRIRRALLAHQPAKQPGGSEAK
jgi:hypothetical protein